MYVFSQKCILFYCTISTYKTFTLFNFLRINVGIKSGRRYLIFYCKTNNVFFLTIFSLNEYLIHILLSKMKHLKKVLNLLRCIDSLARLCSKLIIKTNRAISFLLKYEQYNQYIQKTLTFKLHIHF